MRTRVFAALAAAGLCLAAHSDRAAWAQLSPPESQARENTPPDPSQGLVYICPMDPDVRAHNAGACRRCGMKLVAGVADPAEFHLDVQVFPPAPRPGQKAALQFLVRDPWKDRPVSRFNVVHERFFHAFVVSEDLEFFQHGHPIFVSDGVFQYAMTFPKPGVFRVLGDFYPAGATPQLTSDTIIVPGTPPPPSRLERDYAAKNGPNLKVSFTTVPEQAVATARTQLRFTIEGTHALQRYLGSWAHMLVASSDLIDMMHEHPLLADGGPKMEFELVFPRPSTYRLWLQLQSDGTVNTVHFDVPVAEPAVDTESAGASSLIE